MVLARVTLGVICPSMLAEAAPLPSSMHAGHAPMTAVPSQPSSDATNNFGSVYASTSTSKSLTTTNVRDFGASGSSEKTQGTISAGSDALALSSPIDFKNGEGVFIPNAGSVFTLPTPVAPSVAVAGGPTGHDTYGYQVVPIDS